MRGFRVLTLVGAVAVTATALFVPSASALAIKEDPPPSGTVGVPYSFRFEMEEGSGSPGMTFRISSGSLPPGLSLSYEGQRWADVRGTPTQAGSYSFYLQAIDIPGPWVCCSERPFTIEIASGKPPAPPKPTVTVTTASLPDANINQPYISPGLTATGATITSWTLAGGTLPAGLTLGANGVISGTPSQSGTFNVLVQANANGGSATKQLSLFVLAPLGLQTLVNRTPPETGLTAKKLVNAALTTGVKAVGGRPPYTFTETGTMPPGLILDSATGKIAGSGTTSGRYPFTVTVTDGTGVKLSVDWTITILPLLDFTTGKGLPVGHVDQFYSARIPVRGKDSATAQFAVAGEIPPGLQVDDTGQLTGTLIKAGVYHIKVYAFPENGAPISKVFSIRVRT
jgi:Putative Ig domain